jgi:hypothetical protein
MIRCLSQDQCNELSDQIGAAFGSVIAGFRGSIKAAFTGKAMKTVKAAITKSLQKARVGLGPKANMLRQFAVNLMKSSPKGGKGSPDFGGNAANKGPVDKSWKDKIHGTAQRTGDNAGHQIRTLREAIKEAKKSDVVSVHLDHGYNRGLGLDPKTISPNRRPDVLSVYKNNDVLRIEIQSKTDIPSVLRSRNSALDSQLRAQGYNPLPPLVLKPRGYPTN